MHSNTMQVANQDHMTGMFVRSHAFALSDLWTACALSEAAGYGTGLRVAVGQLCALQNGMVTGVVLALP